MFLCPVLCSAESCIRAALVTWYLCIRVQAQACGIEANTGQWFWYRCSVICNDDDVVCASRFGTEQEVTPKHDLLTHGAALEGGHMNNSYKKLRAANALC